MQPVIAVPEPLTEAERDRYQRTMAIDGFGEEAQGRLKAATVCCIGAGGLGGPVLQYLAASGVGRLIVVDDDIVEERNLQRQTLYGTTTLGASKAAAAAARLADLNPMVEVIPVSLWCCYHEKLQNELKKNLIIRDKSRSMSFGKQELFTMPSD